MRCLKPALAAAGLLACLAAAPPGALAASRAAPAASLELASAGRAQYCAAKHTEADAYLFEAWVKNRCTQAPYGDRFDYLNRAWGCLCRGID